MTGSRRKRSSNRTTLQDVAREVGVSPITVSRALRDPEQVSDPVRQAVGDAVRKLGYIPNRAARRLASTKSQIVCIVIPSLSNIVFADVARAIDEILLPEGYHILIGNTHYSPVEEEAMIRTFLEHSPDGMILTGVDQTDYSQKILKNSDIPIVQIMEMGSDAIDMNVGFSHFQAGRDITQHLIDGKRKHIGFMGAQMDPRTQRRLQGFQKALEESDLQEGAVISTSIMPSTVKLGGELLLDMLSQNPELDAVFCCNDDLAMGAIFECQRSNIAVPKQLAIAGFNDLEPSRSLNPSLTTVLTPRYEMGQCAARLLLKRMKGGDMVEDEKNVDMGYEIVVRNST